MRVGRRRARRPGLAWGGAARGSRRSSGAARLRRPHWPASGVGGAGGAGGGRRPRPAAGGGRRRRAVCRAAPRPAAAGTRAPVARSPRACPPFCSLRWPRTCRASPSPGPGLAASPCAPAFSGQSRRSRPRACARPPPARSPGAASSRRVRGGRARGVCGGEGSARERRVTGARLSAKTVGMGTSNAVRPRERRGATCARRARPPRPAAQPPPSHRPPRRPGACLPPAPRRSPWRCASVEVGGLYARARTRAGRPRAPSAAHSPCARASRRAACAAKNRGPAGRAAKASATYGLGAVRAPGEGRQRGETARRRGRGTRAARPGRCAGLPAACGPRGKRTRCDGHRKGEGESGGKQTAQQVVVVGPWVGDWCDGGWVAGWGWGRRKESLTGPLRPPRP
jgi:hypothetical protein